MSVNVQEKPTHLDKKYALVTTFRKILFSTYSVKKKKKTSILSNIDTLFKIFRTVNAYKNMMCKIQTDANALF